VTLIAIVLGLAIGMIVGAVGGGGAILALPVLIYVLDEPVGPAATASLVVVSVAAAIGASSLARHGRVCWRIAFSFAIPAAMGSFFGTLASRSVSAEALILAFVPVMLLAAVLTWRRAGEGGEDGACPHPRLARLLVAGVLVGGMTGFFGVGGGFVIVPVLTLWLGAPFRRAVATSLVIIAITGVCALASHLLTGSRPDLGVTLTLSLSTGAGALLGTLVAERLPQALLRRGFAVIVAAVAVALQIHAHWDGGPPGR
jgi:uncharacterized membrane protein YfcA